MEHKFDGFGDAFGVFCGCSTCGWIPLVGGSAECSSRPEAGQAYSLDHFDLSPLSKFLPAPEGVGTDPWTVTEVATYWFDQYGNMWKSLGNGVSVRAPVARMYGWTFEEEPQQPKPPEPSPIDREIERMMEKRKAKREGVKGVTSPSEMGDAAWAKHVKDRNNAEALERAISKLTHWELPFADRLNPYRGPVL